MNEFYRENGYYLAKGLFGTETLDRLEADYDFVFLLMGFPCISMSGWFNFQT